MSYAKAIQTAPEQTEIYPPLPCLWCRTPTARVTLAQYGARCFSCYETYCSTPDVRFKPPLRVARNVLREAE